MHFGKFRLALLRIQGILLVIICTVVLKRKSKWHHLWSKLPISDLVFYNIKLPPCSGSLGSTLQLTGALKRGTVWTSSSTGIGIMKGRSWTLVFY